MNYWAIAPWPNDNAQMFEQVWGFDREHGTIAIRWDGIGDPSGLSPDQIEQKLLENSNAKDERAAAGMIWRFYNQIAPEDVIVARRGRHLCIGIGRVKHTAYFDFAQGMRRLNGLMSPYVGASFIDVEWQRVGTWPVSEMFTIGTVSNIGEAKYVRLFGRAA